MSVSAISSSGGFTPVDWQSKMQQRKADFQSLAQALQSGDLNSAQQAFASLQKDFPATRASAASSAIAPAAGSTNSNDLLNTLSKALQSGNLSAAQQAFAQLQQVHKGGHHRHHQVSTAAAAVNGATGSANTGSSGGTLNIQA